MKNNVWDYSAALGFGRISIWDDFLAKSYVGRLHRDFGYQPVATFDLGIESGAVYIGSYNQPNGSTILGTI